MRGRVAGALMLALALGAPPRGARSVSADAPTLGVQVNRAVDRGVAWLRKQQNPDGSFRGPYANEYPAGYAALGAYSLAKSLVPTDDPAVQKAVAFVKSRRIAKTYEAAVSILALDALKDPAQDEWIRLAARWLEENVNAKEGVWSYPFGPSKEHYKTDLSNTQFAALGLWVAEAHGYRASRDLWERLARTVPEYQAPCGAFFYATNRGGREGNGSMTTAGLTVLSLALERISGNDRDLPYVGRAAKAVTKGWEYLEKRFTVEANPDGAFSATEGALYYLYGLERVAALTNRAKIGGHDWYREGARQLVAIQDTDGSWGGNTDGTCYALLFLRQATATRLGREGGKLEGAGVAPPAAPFKAPANDVPYVRRWLVLGPFENLDDSELSTDTISEANVAPRAGHRSDRFTWTICRSPYTYVSFRHALSAPDHSLSYAFTYLHATKDVDLVLWLGNHDGARVILDGKTVHDRHFHGGYGPDRWPVAAHLAAGPHRLLYKLEEWTGWNGAWLRLAHPDGSAATELVPSLSAGAPELQDGVRLAPNAYSLADLLRILPPDGDPTLDFGRSEDLDRVVIAHSHEGWPRWSYRSELKADQPHPGASGFVAVFPESQTVPTRVIRRVRLPTGFPFVRLSVSADPYEGKPNVGDFVLEVSVFDGAPHVLRTAVIEVEPPSPAGWKTFDVDLRAYAGKDVLLVAAVAAGGKTPWWNEEAFIDEMTVGTSLR